MKKMIMNVFWKKRDGWKSECKGNLFLVNSSWMKNNIGLRSVNDEIRELNNENYLKECKITIKQK
jgi:hypothetical protein